MKKILLFLLMLSCMTLVACTGNTNTEKYTLPDVSGKTLVEAIVEVNMEVTLNHI